MAPIGHCAYRLNYSETENVEQLDDIKAIEEAMKDSKRIPWEQARARG